MKCEWLHLSVHNKKFTEILVVNWLLVNVVISPKLLDS